MGTMTGKRTGYERRKRAFMSVILIMAILVAYVVPNGLTLTTVYADVGDVPSHTKTATSNNDGTYTLELSVTGDADTSQQTVANVNVIIVYDRSSSMTSNRIGGNNSPRRADAAEKVVYDFVHKLFSYKTSPTATNIQMALVTFAVGADRAVGWTSTESDIVGTNTNPTFSRDGAVNSARQNYSTNANGTNWEHGLYEALELLRDADADPTFVIMITDGACSASGTDGDGDDPGYPPTMSFQQFYTRYSAATGNARSIQTYDTAGAGTSNTNLYGIYAYGTEADLLDDLIYFSLNGSDRSGMNGDTNTNGVDGYYYNAQQNEQVVAAVENIFSKIVEALGVSSVAISDGTTKEVSAGTDVAELLEVDENSYKYWLSIGLDGNNQFKRVNMGNGEEETYTVTDNGDGTCTVTWGTNSVTVNGTVKLGTFKYQWEESNALYEKAPPEAQLNGSSVDWDLSSVGTLLDGVTYSVSFTVYPSQTTLDYVADIMNDPGAEGAWADLPGDVKKYIDVNGNLETNTTATLSYIDTREENPKQHEETFENPPAVSSSAVEMLAVSKKWENALDEQTQPDVTLVVTRDAKPTYEVKLSKDNTPEAWANSVYISVGIMGSDGKPLEGSEGHDFTFIEPETGSGVTYHWELNVPIVHPMLINGERTMLVKVDEKHPLPEGATTYKFEDYKGVESTYYVDNEMVSLTATNERRSSLLLTKEVTGDDVPEDAVFPFTINVKNSLAPETPPENDPNHDSDYWVWISVRDKDGNRINEGVENATSAGNGWWYAPSGTDVIIPVKAGYSIRINNLPTGTKYTVTEGELPYGFIFKEAGMTREEGTGTYESFKGGRTSTGEIESTNTIYKITYKNEYALVDINVDKVWDDNSDQDGIRPETLTLTLNGESGVTYADPEITKSEDGNTWTYVWKGVRKYDDEGNEITYTVSENTVPEGYECTGSPAQDGGTITNKHVPEKVSVSVTKVWDDNGNQDGKRPGSVTFTLYADGKEAGSITLDGTADENGESAAWVASWNDLDKCSGGKEIKYTVKETSTLPEGYTVSYGDNGETFAVDGGTITNKYTPGVTTITIKKVWDDNGDQDGKRSGVTATMTLYKTVDGQKTKVEKDQSGTAITNPVTVGAADDWSNKWENLPVYEGGKAISYSVEETLETPNGYEIDGDAEVQIKNGGEGTVTNKYTPEVTTITINKVWDDDSDRDGKRSGVVAKMTLYKTVDGQKTKVEKDQSGAAITNPATVGAADDWSNTWENLPVYEGGKPISYSVEETLETPNGYEIVGAAEVQIENGGEGTITNKHVPETIDVTIVKEWDDSGDIGGIRPDSLDVQLTANGKNSGAAQTLDEANGWSYTWKDLFKYEDGKEIEYDADETAVPTGYTKTDKKTEKTDDGLQITVTNKYTPTPVIVDPPVQKIIEGKEDLYNNGDFTFTIECTSAPEGVEAPMPTNTSVTNSPEYERTDKKGYYEFGEIEFTLPGTYVYTVKETGNVAGVTNDPDAETGKTITFVVKDDGTGVLVVTPTTDEVELSFTNVYSVKPIDFVLSASKTLEVESGNNAPDIDGKYTLSLKDEEGNVIDSKPNPDGKGTAVDFKTLTFEKPGEYKYTVTEEGEVTGVTNGTASYDVVITVTDNGDGTMTAKVTKGSQTTEFVNTYSVESTTAKIEAEKVLTGRDLKEGEFSFTLTDSDGKVVETVTNKADGSVVFSELTFDAPGDYTYTIKEVEGDEFGMTYDSKTVTVTVLVIDNGDGTMSAEVTYDPAGATFENTYEYHATAELTPAVTKELEGRDLEEGEFSFILSDGDGKEIETVTNAEDGSVVFSKLTFTEEDAGKTFTYTIEEVEGTDGDITYDTHTVTITVEVVDDGEGVLRLKATYEGSQTFHNVYENPNTGDTTNLVLWIGLMLLAVIGFAAILLLRRKKRS